MKLQDIPTGQRTLLDDFRNQWEALGSYDFLITDDQLISMWQQRTPSTLSDFSQMAWNMGLVPAQFQASNPWLLFGITLDQYHSQATTYATEYKKITGQEIPADQLAKAFATTKDATGGLLSGAEYGQQLMSDLNIRKTYGWVKYGYDYNQFQQQKLSMQQQLGRDPTDEEAVTQLQYMHAAQGGDHSARLQTQQPAQGKQQVGVGMSEVR